MKKIVYFQSRSEKIIICGIFARNLDQYRVQIQWGGIKYKPNKNCKTLNNLSRLNGTNQRNYWKNNIHLKQIKNIIVIVVVGLSQSKSGKESGKMKS